MVALAGGENYGALSIACGLGAECVIERTVGPRSFWPAPKVESAVIKVEFKSVAKRLAIPWVALRAVTNAVFGSRRKILKNALKGLFSDVDVGGMLAGMDIDPDCRGETLPPERFLALAERLKDR